ncbi:hypothetical protein Y032_0026g1423 [Ancylostoma ceylanicum]|uniref:G-protein coupled receptors family 1 profile domain-containing protein n=1 Tax=Ancylostoma ceylanicum TaxID=53326 RepID=A0A016UUK4_9BILA|nr:hypothetical protein Y032_0026g1423 [Ancylostoma ceylanicum]
MSGTDQEWSGRIVAGATILTIGVMAGSVNIAAIFSIYRSSPLHNAFGILCAANLLSDIGFLLPEVFWAAPAEIFGWSDSVMSSVFGKRMGMVLIMFCSISLYTQLLIAINRLVAILAPMSYSTLFSPKRTVYILVGLWIFGLLRSVPHFIDGCEIVYKVNSFAWDVANTPCGRLSIFYLEYVMGTTVCGTVIVVNTVTFIMIYKHTKKLSAMNESFAKKEAILHKNNLSYFLQSSTKATLFVLALIICYFISDFATTKWETFATTTLTLEIAHSVNGVIIFVFNDSLRCGLTSPALICWRERIKLQSSSGTKSKW